MHHNLFKHHPLKDLQIFFQFLAVINKEILLDMKKCKYTNNSYFYIKSTQLQGTSSQNNSNNNNKLALVFLKIIFINKDWNTSFFIS